MSIANDIKKEILNSIDIIVKGRLKNLSFNRYIEGKVIERICSTKNYKVKINGEEYVIPAREGLDLEPNDVVLICIANNNYSHKFIDLKRPY